MVWHGLTNGICKLQAFIHTDTLHLSSSLLWSSILWLRRLGVTTWFTRFFESFGILRSLFFKFFYDLCLSILHLQNLGLPTSLAVEVFCMWLFGIALQTCKAFATAETTGLKTSRAAENEMSTWLATDDMMWDTDRIWGSPISKTSDGGNERR